MTGNIHFGNTSFAYDVLHVARKTMEIAVHPNMRVVVKAPLGILQDAIEGRLRKRARWVLRQIDYFQQFDPRTPARHYVSGETHLYLGRQYRLKVVRGDANQVKMARGRLVVEMAGELQPEQVAAYLEAWYRTRARQHFQACLERCAQDFVRRGYALPNLQIRKMQTRWGSLSQNSTLTLNLALIRAPRECIEYVITHELCHLKYDDHSPSFYRFLERLMPDWERRKRELELSLI
ncbi:MAG TPA: SprT family zinc-dependent metalloprotease [Gallionella sp.]|nr:SprT family zinc-dependent metalloprotease [Gallionella sp.]